jgi:hypothetical protein
VKGKPMGAMKRRSNEATKGLWGRCAAGALCVALLAWAPAALALQSDPPKPDQPKQDEPKQDEPRQEQPQRSGPPDLPDLDELLGLPGRDRPAREGEELPDAPDAARQELEQRLTGAQIAEQYRQAVELMGRTAERLQSARDTSLPTQRLQEEIIRKLDMLIDAAEQSQSQPRGRPSPDQPQQPGQQQQRPEEGRQAAGEPGEGDPMPPGREEGPLRAVGAGSGAQWGALPERVREALRQGESGSFSSLYRSLTEAYYRRLAEEADR